MAWYSFIEVGTSSVFSPKVKPDPEDAKRLNEKFQRALQQSQQKTPPPLRIVLSSRNSPEK